MPPLKMLAWFCFLHHWLKLLIASFHLRSRYLSQYQILRKFNICKACWRPVLRSIIFAFLSVYSTFLLIAPFFLVNLFIALFVPHIHHIFLINFVFPLLTHTLQWLCKCCFFSKNLLETRRSLYILRWLYKRFAKLYRKRNIDQQNKAGPKYLKFWKNENASEN